MANSPIPEAGGGIARRGGWLIVLSAPPGFDCDRLGEATAEMAGYARRPGICAVAGSARWAEPHEIASAALLLTDPASSYLTGAILPVDGGWTAH